MHFLVTGHTGFKGAWLILLLRALGHKVSGLALEPQKESLFLLANLERDLANHTIADIRDTSALVKAIELTRPDVVIHLAAQSLVLESYASPTDTFTTNVVGTLNLLTAVTESACHPVTLIITTDKVYKDVGKDNYCETDALGGYDPYSASKSMADILTQSWAATSPATIHIARAGNVIGAYDFSKNRLLPDMRAAFESNRPLKIRNPNATRPWQHVLDCLMGYLKFVDGVVAGQDLPIALNFGPDTGSRSTVSEVVRIASSRLGPLSIEFENFPGPRETQRLSLNTDLAKRLLHWENKITLEDAIFHSLMATSGDVRRSAIDSVDKYLEGSRLTL